MAQKMTQKQLILNYIEQFGSISPMEAFPLGITKLATRISELQRNDGYIFDIDIEYVKNKFEKTVHYARYSNPRKIEIRGE